MAGQFSSLADLKLHWPAIPAELEAEATRKIEEASIEIRTLYSDIDARIDSGALTVEAVRLVVNRMVKRAIDSPDEELAGVTSATSQTGPFATTLNFSNPDGAMYLTASDKRILGSGRSVRQAWTITPGG